MRYIYLTILLLTMITTQAFAEARFVQRVEDGQTLKLMSGERVKLIGLDTSLSNNDDAAQFVRELVSGSVVMLEYDEQKFDNEGNILAYVWFEYQIREISDVLSFPDDYELHYVEDAEGVGRFFVFLNATVIKTGLAQPSSEMANLKHAELFQQLYQERIAKPALVQAKVSE